MGQDANVRYDSTTGETVLVGPRGHELRFKGPEGLIKQSAIIVSGSPDSTRQVWTGIYEDTLGSPGNFQPGDNWYFSINGGAVEKEYLFVSALSSPNDILLGASFAESCANAVLALNADPASYGVKHLVTTPTWPGFVASGTPPALLEATVGAGVFLVQTVPAELPELESSLPGGEPVDVILDGVSLGHPGQPGTMILQGTFPDYILYLNVGNALGEEWLGFTMVGA